jgi:MarR family transcriptional regulator, organic hydroperoxide resistance regulator
MIQEPVEDTTALAKALLDFAPKFFQRLRTNVSLNPESPGIHPDLRAMLELRATVGQVGLLRILLEHERCMMQELAEHLTVAPSTVTAMVKRLLAHGYVERIRDDVDWRVVWIMLTEHGRQAMAIYDQARLISFQNRLERLSDEDRHALAEALPALLRLVEI